VSRIYKLPISSQAIKVQFWDQADVSNMFPKTVLQQAHGVVLTIDLQNRISFDTIKEWNDKITASFKPNT